MILWHFLAESIHPVDYNCCCYLFYNEIVHEVHQMIEMYVYRL